MKKLYSSFILPAVFFILILYGHRAQAQCPGGYTGGTTAFDTTVRFASGVTNKQIKFPKFNPQAGIVTCVRLVVTMIGVVDTIAVENLVDAPVTVVRTYNRSDNMSGPGLTPSLSNSFGGTASIPLAANDAVNNSGPDFYSNARDTVLRQQMTRTLTDSTAISEFYGSDSVVYNYAMNVGFSLSSSDVSNYIRSSALVNFRFEYCTCPLSTLPLGLRNFSVSKVAANAAQLRWDAEADNDNYRYEIEWSRDGKNFTTATVVAKQFNTPNPVYLQRLPIKANEYGTYYYRVKQHWANGYYKYTGIRTVEFTNPLFSNVSLYPNPSSGIVGIKFVSVKAGKFLVQISNAQGQTVEKKEVTVAETDYKVVATLQKGLYYIKLIEVATGASCINQMLIQ